MPKFNIGDTVRFNEHIYDLKGRTAKVVAPPDWYKREDADVIWTDIYDGATYASTKDVELVSRGDNMNKTIEIDGVQYVIGARGFNGSLILTPTTPTVDNAPVGSLWIGPKGGVYIVLKDGKVFEARAQAVYDRLPKSATFVSYTATVNIVKGEK